MAGQTTKRRLGSVVLALGSFLLSCALAAAQDLFRLTHNLPGDSKPITLYANEVITWTEQGQQIFLLKGNVLVEHGVVQGRMLQAVAWVDQQKKNRTGIIHVHLYAEGDVHLENGAQSRKDQKALLELTTRGELRIKSYQSKVVQQPRPQDSLFKRALASRSPQAARQPAATVQQTSAQEAPAPGSGPPAAPVLPSQVPPAPDPPPSSAGTPLGLSGSPPAGAPPEPPTVGLPLPAPLPGPVPPPGPLPPPATSGPPRQFSIAPRTAKLFDMQTKALPSGEQVVIVSGGVILTVRNVEHIGLLDIEADRLVLWMRGNAQQILNALRSPQGQTSRELEFYLAGNVEIRQQNEQGSRILRAEEVYYDVSRNVALALQADLEFQQPGLADPVHLRAEELRQLSQTQFQATRAEVFSSRLPSDPGLKVVVASATVEETRVPRRSIFGRPAVDAQGRTETEPQRLFRSESVFVKIEDIPVLYLPFLQGDADDPLGPLEGVRFNQDRIFGTQIYTSFDGYDLFGIRPLAGTRWRLHFDYLSDRGPAVGSDFNYAGKNLFDLPGRYTGLVKAYGIIDDGIDRLGGPRGPDQDHPDGRGRILWRHIWDLPDDFTLQAQASVLSDKNFLEQYYKNEFDNDLNQETFLYLKQQRDNWAWTLLTEPRIRNWVTETEWLPRTDGYLIGQSLFDRLIYTVHGSGGFAQLKPTDVPPPAFLPTDQPVGTGRFDLVQNLSLPFSVGPVRMVPYGVLDLTYFTEDLTDNDRGRFYGGGGVRGSIPLTRLYPEVHSQLLNLNGINHKIVVSGNYYVAHSDTSFSQLPQLDRLDDDATDQARRDLRVFQPAINPVNGPFLATSPLFNPQTYAIRRLVENRVDTLDTIEVFQADVRQRWQTKRGYPGLQHIIDWITLDLSVSFFPNPARDNFGHPFAFLEYDWTWNIGDRTALVSSGWADPFDNGARAFSIGAFLNRPDRTNVYVGYREIDLVNSQAVTGALTYVFSPKYAMTASSTYDFGTNQSLSNSLVITRMGSDLQVSFGLTYNAIVNNFGVTFEVLPNVATANRRLAGLPAPGPGFLGVR